MKEYKFVPLRIGRYIGTEFVEHRRIIEEYAKQGFRYVGYFPTVTTDFGRIIEADLIFESETEKV